MLYDWLTADLERRFESWRRLNPRAGRGSLARALGLSDRRAKVLINRERDGLKEVYANESTNVVQATNLTSEEQITINEDTQNDIATVTVTNTPTRVFSPNELLTRIGFDPSEWECVKQVAKTSETAISPKAIGSSESGWSRESSTPVIVPLYHVTVEIKRRRSEINLKALGDEILQRIANHAPNYPTLRRGITKDPHALVLSIPDLHLGKLAHAVETGEEYNLEIASTMFETAMNGLLEKTGGYALEKIIFPVGNDLLHADGLIASTTKGTPQDTAASNRVVFAHAEGLMIKAIETCLSIAPTTVIPVPGNHARGNEFWLYRVLKAFFARTADADFTESLSDRQYVKYGKNLLGFTHGDEEKHLGLPALMALEQPQLWGEVTTREWILGHFHSKKELSFMPLSETHGVTMRTLNSLSAADGWHNRKGYKGIRAATALLYSFDKGYTGEVMHR